MRAATRGLRASAQQLLVQSPSHPPPIPHHRQRRGRSCMTAVAGAATSAATGSPPAVTVFTTPGCKYCRRAKEALGQLQVAYKEVDVSVSSELRAALNEVTGQRTVPQVFASGQLIGGSDSLLARIEDGSFGALVGAPAADHQQLPAQLQAAVEAAAAGGQAGAAAGNPALRLPLDLQRVLDAATDARTGVPRSLGQPGNSLSNAFTGRALVEWLAQHSSSSSDEGAAPRVAEQLLAANAITPVAAQQPRAPVAFSAADHYRLRSEAPRELAWGAPLNTAYWWNPAAAPRPAEAVAEELRGRILSLYDRHLSADGRAVDYAAIRRDPAFWDYVDATAELQQVDLSPLSREALTCFAINLYNALCIHALTIHGAAKYNTTLGRSEFFQKAARYSIGGADYVLDDLENGVLRGNQPGASSLGMLLKLPCLSRGPFKAGDPRAQHVVEPVDPRIHFALVCGARSCPPIKLYSPATLDEGLTGAAEAFCASEVEIDAAARKVTLSKIFSWYYVDFGADKAARLRFLLPYLPQQQRGQLEQLLARDPAAGGIKVEHRPYDWTLNSA